MHNVSEHKQPWERMKRLTYSGAEGSVVLEIYRQPEGKMKVEAYICNLMVEPDCRGKGYGKSLIEWAEKKAKEHGFKKVYLSWRLTESKDFVRRWYERMGYKEVAFGNDGSLMMKEL